MAILADLTARESEIIRILKILNLHLGRFVVIGGYAVNALTSHRFSVDCDLVIQQSDLKLFEDILSAEGYTEQKRARQFRGIYDATTREYFKLVGGRKVSMDLLVNGLICRQTGGAWSYEVVKKNSVESNVVGLTDSAIALVPKRELLIAMKIHSGRGADLRDMVMLSEGADWNIVAEFMKCGETQKVVKQLSSAIETISGKEFSSALRAEFGLRSDVEPLIRRTVEGLNKLKESLSENF